MYKIKTYIPSLSSYCYLNEFNNKNYIDVNKYIMSNDNEGLHNFLNTFLDEKIKLSIDKFFILIYLRMLSIGNEVRLKYSDNTGFTSSLSVMLNSLLKRILENVNFTVPDYNKEEMLVKFTQPTQLYYNNVVDLLLDIVKDISVDGKLMSYTSLKPTYKRQILSRLKEDIIKDIKLHLKNNTPVYPLTIVEDKNIFNINLFDSSPIKTLKLIFKNNISSLYLKLYHSTQKLNLTYNDFCTMTPSEIDLLISIYKSANNIK